MRKIQMILLMLALVLTVNAQEVGSSVSSSREIDKSIAFTTDSTALADTTYNALKVVENVSKFLTQSGFGEVTHYERNDSNTYASCTIEYRTDRKVAWMLCDGFAWQYLDVNVVNKRIDGPRLVDTYQHTYKGKIYYITITRLQTGHDSCFIYVDIDNKMKSAF